MHKHGVNTRMYLPVSRSRADWNRPPARASLMEAGDDKGHGAMLQWAGKRGKPLM